MATWHTTCYLAICSGIWRSGNCVMGSLMEMANIPHVTWQYVARTHFHRYEDHHSGGLYKGTGCTHCSKTVHFDIINLLGNAIYYQPMEMYMMYPLHATTHAQRHCCLCSIPQFNAGTCMYCWTPLHYRSFALACPNVQYRLQVIIPLLWHQHTLYACWSWPWKPIE